MKSLNKVQRSEACTRQLDSFVQAVSLIRYSGVCEKASLLCNMHILVCRNRRFVYKRLLFYTIYGIIYLPHYCYFYITGVLCPVVTHTSTTVEVQALFSCASRYTEITIVWQQLGAVAFLQVRSSLVVAHFFISGST